MRWPKTRLFVLIVIILASLLILEPLPVPTASSGTGIHVDLSSPLHALRSVFGAVPCPGRWGTALLFDGTLGIGGAPPLLLRRLAALLRRGGSVLAELDPAVRGIRTLLARIERGAAASAWFPWSRVGPDAIEPVARQAGLRIQDRWEEAGRWFATAVKP